MKFNFFSSIPFWISFCGIVIVVRLFDKKTSLRRYLLLVSSVLMILCIPSFTMLNLAYLLILIVFSYLAGHVLNRKPDVLSANRRKWVSIAGIMGVLGFLAFYKYGFIQTLLLGASSPERTPGSRVVFMIGVSYFSFRMIHFLVESYRKKIEDLDLLTYIDYIIFFPAFISGPINRYNHFASQVCSPPGPGWPPISGQAASASSTGCSRSSSWPSSSTRISCPQARCPLGHGPFEAVLGLYAYAFYFYFDFAGYYGPGLGLRPPDRHRASGEFQQSFPQKEHPGAVDELAHVAHELARRLHLLADRPQVQGPRLLPPSPRLSLQPRHDHHLHRLRHVAWRDGRISSSGGPTMGSASPS